MKKTLLLLTAATLLSGCRPTGFRYTLTGHIEGLNDSVALVESVTKDTLTVLPAPDGSFRYKGRYDEPTAAALVRKNGQTAAVLYIEPGNIRIEGRLNAEESSNHDKIEYYPSGTPTNDAFGAHLRFVNRALHAYNFEDHDQAYRAALLDSLIGSSARNLAANTDNIFGVAMVDGIIHYDKDISRARVDSIVSLFPPHLRTCRLMKRPLEHIERVLRSRELARYVDFTANDAGGNPVTLSQVMKRSRYLLLDFWFADCVPCRSEMPHIRTAYEAYHDKGFEVVGLSTDKDAGAWKKAIAEDGMAWINLTDADRRVCDLYSVTKFPTNYLIDCSTGEVVARELRGKVLAETLGELFKQ